MAISTLTARDPFASPSPPPSAISPKSLPVGKVPQLPRSVEEQQPAETNMLYLGEVSVANHPDSPPAPMAIPRVYLLPSAGMCVIIQKVTISN